MPNYFNKNKKRISALSLVEVLVTMGIIAILIGIGIFGISVAQRNGRDTLRKAAIAEMDKKMAEVLDQYGVYPTRILIVLNNGENYIQFCADTNCVRTERLDLKNAARANGARNFPSTSLTSTGCCTNREYTRYYVQFKTDGVAYAACLENKQLYYGGTSKQPITGNLNCP